MKLDIDMDNALCTLKKIQFFDDLEKLGITPRVLLGKIKKIYNCTTDESKILLYEKAIYYSRPSYLTIDYIYRYIFNIS